MNQKQAIARLTKRLGRKLAWRVNKNALRADERDEEREASRALRAEAQELKAALEARCAELLKDPQYVALRERYKEADDAANRALSRSMSKAITVGKIELGFFLVAAEGDTWEEVVQKVESSSDKAIHRTSKEPV